MGQPARHTNEDLEPLTPEQRASVQAWRDGGMKDSAQVAALRKRARGEPLTDEENRLLASASRKPIGAGIAHAQVEAELAERQRRRG
jgi:hypothetical protein